MSRSTSRPDLVEASASLPDHDDSRPECDDSVRSALSDSNPIEHGGRSYKRGSDIEVRISSR